MKCLFLYSCNARVTEEKYNTVCSTEKHKTCETYKGLQTKRPSEWAWKSIDTHAKRTEEET